MTTRGVLSYPWDPAAAVAEIMGRKPTPVVSPAMVVAGVNVISRRGLPQAWDEVESLVAAIYSAMERAR